MAVVAVAGALDVGMVAGAADTGTAVELRMVPGAADTGTAVELMRSMTAVAESGAAVAGWGWRCSWQGC